MVVSLVLSVTVGGMMIPNEYLVGGLEHGFYFPQELVGFCLIQSDEHFFGLEWINHKKKNQDAEIGCGALDMVYEWKI